MLNKLFQREPKIAPPPAVLFSQELSIDEVNITPPAVEKMQELMTAADGNFPGIRVFVMGGGCGGMNYSMTYAQDINTLDTVLNCGDFKVVVDSVALNYLKGCTIDYVREGINENFVFKDVFQSIGGSGGCAGCGAAGGGSY